MSSGFNFGAAKPTGNVTFGSSSLSAPLSGGLNFGGTPVSSTTPTLTFAGFSNPVASTSASTSISTSQTFSFGTALSNEPKAGFSFSTNLGATAAPTLSISSGGTAIGGFGLNSFKAPTFGSIAATSTGMTATIQPKSTIGLGGTQFTTGLGGTSVNCSYGSTSWCERNLGVGQTDPKVAVKDTPMDNAFIQSVDDFKRCVKEERAISSELSHVSSHSFDSVRLEAEGLSRLVSDLSAGMNRTKAQLDKLKSKTARELLNVEIAQRTKDMPPALQYENVAPYEYFANLVDDFEAQMHLYRTEIEETENYLQSSMYSSLSSDDVNVAINKLHTTFTCLAGKYQVIHEAVRAQKVAFNEAQRQLPGAPFDMFDRSSTVSVVGSDRCSSNMSVPTTLGPSPFGCRQNPISIARANLLSGGLQNNSSVLMQNVMPSSSAVGGFNTTFAPPVHGLLGSSLSPFSIGTIGNQVINQTQSTTIGNKRGKR